MFNKKSSQQQDYKYDLVLCYSDKSIFANYIKQVFFQLLVERFTKQHMSLRIFPDFGQKNEHKTISPKKTIYSKCLLAFFTPDSFDDDDQFAPNLSIILNRETRLKDSAKLLTPIILQGKKAFYSPPFDGEELWDCSELAQPFAKKVKYQPDILDREILSDRSELVRVSKKLKKFFDALSEALIKNIENAPPWNNKYLNDLNNSRIYNNQIDEIRTRLTKGRNSNPRW